MTQQSKTILDYLYGSAEKGMSTIFKSGETATHEHGVLYRGPWEREGDGFSEHTRRCAVALAKTGVPLQLRGFSGIGFDAYKPDNIVPLLSTFIQRYSVEVYQMIVQGSMLHNVAGHVGAAQHQVYLSEEELTALNSFRVVYSVWERDRVSDDLVKIMSRMGQIWTACNDSALMLAKCGVPEDKIFVVPCPFAPDDPLLEVAKKKRDRPRRPGPPRFYHIGKWEPRKAQDKLVRAFLMAFRPGEAHLFMKVGKLRDRLDDYPFWIDEAFLDALRIDRIKNNGWTLSNVRSSIQYTDIFLKQDQMLKIHEYSDVYVTLSRGEGFDMPAFDAKLAGNLMVYTPSGGPQDFNDALDVQVPASGSVPCHPFYDWEKEARYLDFSEEDAAAAFSLAAQRVNQGLRSTRDLSSFSMENVGKKMRNNLEMLVKKHGGRLS